MKTILEYGQGIHLNVPNAVYHGRHLGLVSKGALDLVSRSPAHYKAWVDGAQDEESEALTFGQDFHCALLEPARFEDEYTVEPKFGDCRKKENKAARDDWRQINQGRRIITHESLDTIKGMVKAVRAHPLASKIISEGESEVTVRWKDPHTGLQCKTRSDYWVKKRRMVADVKTAEDASREAFRRSIVKYRYHIQDALYRAGFGAIGEPIEHFVFVVVEKKPPFAIAEYTLTSDGIHRGHSAAITDMEALASAVRNDSYPGYPVTIQTLDLPPWAA